MPGLPSMDACQAMADELNEMAGGPLGGRRIMVTPHGVGSATYSGHDSLTTESAPLPDDAVMCTIRQARGPRYSGRQIHDALRAAADGHAQDVEYARGEARRTALLAESRRRDLDVAEGTRDEAIRTLLDLGASHSEIAVVTNLSRGRIGQIAQQ